MISGEEYLHDIPIGHQNAKKRSRQGDRWYRQSIERANNSGDCIINVGHGYFRPDPEDETDAELFEIYVRKERARIKEIRQKLIKMERAFYGEICT